MQAEKRRCAVSVIVPVYNGERYLERCVRSLTGQSLRDIEIVIVNDGSTDSSAQIARRLADEDSRIVCCDHAENKGLFQARLTGVNASCGDYIAFTDADDAVSFDWLRMLYQRATEAQSDITAGRFLCDYGNGKLTYFNLDPLRQDLLLEGDEVFARFISQEGSCYSWHLVWNKLYTRALWMDAMEELQAFSDAHMHFVMCEDIAFSSAMWVRAKRMCTVGNGAYYYYNRANEDQSTTGAVHREKTLRNLQNVVNAFTLMREQMEGRGLLSQYRAHYDAWVLYYAKMYFHFLSTDAHKNKRGDAALIQGAFGIDKSVDVTDYHKRCSWFYTLETPIDTDLLDSMEACKKRIVSEEKEVVSFDVFDTLIQRPFWKPSDLFYLLNDSFTELFGLNSFVSFVDVRVNAERTCREQLNKRAERYEDITLEEIYEQIALDCKLDRDRLMQIKEKEKELELRFCTERRIGKQLYELAVAAGKRIIIVSDMYLPEETVSAILQKNGYRYEKLYLSSALRLSKAQKSLFRHVQKDLSFDAQRFVHVGDNAESDVAHPRSIGWDAIGLPRAIDLFCARVPRVYTGEAYARIVGCNGQIRDAFNAENLYLGYRCAMALVANRLYSDPFEATAPESDFNGDPYRIGYFALGQYLYAITDWMIAQIGEADAGRIHFVARDGYLPMQAYRIFRAFDPTLPAENYLYVSRKALATADVFQKEDLYSFWHKFIMFRFSPKKLEALFLPYYRNGADSVQRALDLSEKEFSCDMTSQNEFYRVMSAIGDRIDFEKLAAYQHRLGDYFSRIIQKQDLLFDIGYSGRAEAALSALLGFSVNSLYVHASSQFLDDRRRMSGFTNKCFYDFKPAVTGVIREHVFMCPAPSAIGYEDEGGALVPVFEEYKTNPENEVIIRIIQQAALDFVHDMKATFAEYIEQFAYQKADMAYAFEHYLHYAKPLDRSVFGCVVFEDDVGEGKTASAVELWNQDIKKFRLERMFSLSDMEVFDEKTQDEKLRNTLTPYAKWKKALCYLILDRRHFLDSVRQRLGKKK